MSLRNSQLEAYAEAHSTAPSAVLTQLQHETEASIPLPHMLAGPLQGACAGYALLLVKAQLYPRNRHIHRLLCPLPGRRVAGRRGAAHY